MIGNIPGNGDVRGHGKFRSSQQRLQLPQEWNPWLGFEQSDDISQKGYSWNGVGKALAIRLPVLPQKFTRLGQLA